MYCRECGEKYVTDNAIICIKCGVGKDKGNKYCPECGNLIANPNSEVCLSCGSVLRKKQISQVAIPPKQKIVTALFAFFLGGIGIHRFYLGYTTLGIIYVALFILGFLTLGITWAVSGIWAFVEFILILCGSINDINGQPLI